MDYTCEKGAKRNFEPWRQNANEPQETDEERLDRLEAEAAKVDPMDQLEGKMVDAKREMAIADALDEIRTRNARNERAAKEGVGVGTATVAEEMDQERQRQEEEDAELARKAFAGRDLEEPEPEPEPKPGRELKPDDTPGEEDVDGNETPGRATPATIAPATTDMPPPAAPSFKRGVKRKKDLSAALGIKKKPALV